MQVLELASHKKSNNFISDVFSFEDESLNFFLVGKYKVSDKKDIESKILNSIALLANEILHLKIPNAEELFYYMLSKINEHLINLSKIQKIDFLKNLSLALVLIDFSSQEYKILFSKKGDIKILLKNEKEILDLSENFEEISFSQDFFKNIGVGAVSPGNVLFVLTNEFIVNLQEKDLDEEFFSCYNWIDFWKFSKFYKKKILSNSESCGIIAIFTEEKLLRSLKERQSFLKKMFFSKIGLIIVFIIILLIGFFYNHFINKT